MEKGLDNQNNMSYFYKKVQQYIVYMRRFAFSGRGLSPGMKRMYKRRAEIERGIPQILFIS
jgi:hypothetical protein